MKLKTIISDFVDLFFPNICLRCGRSLARDENYLCLLCLHEMPKTNFHLEPDNRFEKRFWGKVPIVRGTAFFFYQKNSSFQEILHLFKYKGEKGIGLALARYAAVDLLHATDFISADLIVPVPLHSKKLRKRGFNQSEYIARGLSEILKIPVETEKVIRVKENLSQTKKTVYERYENTKDIFDIEDPLYFEGKHILLVDDVLTTGSTLEALMQAFLERVKDIRFSVFTLAIA